MTVPFLSVRPKAIRLKVSPRFPSKLIGGAGIEVTKAQGDYTIDLNYDDFPQIGALPASATYALIYDPTSKTYVQAPITLFGSITEPPNDSTLYGRQNTGGTGSWVKAWPLALTSTGASANLNSITTDGHYYTPDATATNTPTAGHFWYLDVFSINPSQFVRQVATLYEAAGSLTYTRTMVGGTWGPWLSFALGRELLTATRDYFVSPSGSDTLNTGLTAGSPFQTIQKAYDTITAKLDLGGQAVNIKLADGTYTAGLLLTQPWTGGGSVTVQGNAATPANVVVNPASGNNCFFTQCPLPGILTIKDLKIQAVNGHGILTSAPAVINWGNMDFGAFGNGVHVLCNAGGAFAKSISNYTISGGGIAHCQCAITGTITNVLQTITLTGTPAFSQAFAIASRDGAMNINSNTFVGSATGQRYYAEMNGVVSVQGAGATYLPGSIAGTVASGGQYV